MMCFTTDDVVVGPLEETTVGIMRLAELPVGACMAVVVRPSVVEGDDVVAVAAAETIWGAEKLSSVACVFCCCRWG